MEGFITQLNDATADDSDKTFTVPNGSIYEVLAIFVDYTASSDAGNRNVQVDFGDGTNVVAAIPAGDVQAADAHFYYVFSPPSSDLTGERASAYMSTPIPQMFLRPAYTIRVYDSAAIAAAADDMTVRILVRVYPTMPT